MAVGVTLFAFVGGFAGLGTAGAHEGQGLVFGGLVLVAIIALAGAVLVWRIRVAPLLDSTEAWNSRFPRLQTGIIIVWALVETPAILAEVVYLIYGDALSGVLGLVIIWVGIALTWPKQEWLGPDA